MDVLLLRVSVMPHEDATPLGRGRFMRKNRGVALIVSYLLLAVFMAYSVTMTMRTMTERLVAERKRESFQARNLALSAMEQLREDLFAFFAQEVSPQSGDAVQSMAWLDDLGKRIAGASATDEFPLFDVLFNDGVRDGVPDTLGNLRSVTLPVGTGQAWIASICVDPKEEGLTPDCLPDANPMAPRRVTIQATSQVGSTTRTLRGTYQFNLRVSDVFRYAYFINNYGWIAVGNEHNVQINGDIRANGDLDLSGNPADMLVHGELSASLNPAAKNPITNLPSSGTITGDPSSYTLTQYWKNTSHRARPTKNLTPMSNQPPIGGSPKMLAEGLGWDHTQANQPRHEGLPVQSMPYLGDLTFYKHLASKLSGGLSYYKPGDNVPTPIPGVYAGPDGVSGTADDKHPLVLVGTQSKPIEIKGPVVIPGDVIIRGYVKGHGTIYTGRNLHIVGQIKYLQPPYLKAALERNVNALTPNGGRLRQRAETSDKAATPWDETDLGSVCSSATYYGQYFESGQTPPEGCL